MKKFYFIYLLLLGFSASAFNINFTDPVFKAKLLAASPSLPIARNAAGENIKIDINNDGEIQDSEALAVYQLILTASGISDIEGIQYFTNLRILACGGNAIGSINVSMLANLKDLSCHDNDLISLNVANLGQLESILCSINQLTTLDLTGCAALKDLNCSSNALTTLTLSNHPALTQLYCQNNQIAVLNSAAIPAIEQFNCNNNQITALSPGLWPNLSMFDANNNLLTTLYFSSNTYHISANNNLLTGITFGTMGVPFELSISGNAFTTLDLSNVTKMRNLTCTYPVGMQAQSQLVNVNLSGCTDLWTASLGYNKIATIDLTGCSQLWELDVWNNQLTTLDLTPTVVTRLHASYNQLTQLINHATHHYALSDLYVDYNPLTELDLSAWGQIQSGVSINSTQIKRLYLKNGIQQFSNPMMLNLINMNQLEYVCADDSEVLLIQQAIDEGNFTIPANLVANGYCSFEPGGQVYHIDGQTRVDADGNGCDSNDGHYPYLKINMQSGSLNGSVIANNSGSYHIPVQAGSHTMTPAFEHPEYYNVSPTSAIADFPADASPSLHDFCITPNGTHADLEVVLILQSIARPGFDSHYKLIYKNKGNVTLAGTISFTYENNVAFVSANPAVASQGMQVLNWNFTNLQPFEQREIAIVMNVNSPLETPAVNDGDVLHYYASGNTEATDGTPDDNYAFLNQTVVNSFDPNDKTCLEGNAIDPDRVGKYVHYQIRFENTGSANAENIVVKDVIDTEKFDINSLIPMDGSHDFYTRINGNKVEFIFENIQLPFDDANNDGYVMFKIKTKPTLVIGDSFSNSASIYFDYNHPIVTDPAVTNVQLLATKDFDFASEFALYPNPAHDVLNIQSKNNTKIHSIDIYNTLGQLVLAVTKSETISKIDVSDLAGGNYFLKVASDKGISNTRFLKN